MGESAEVASEALAPGGDASAGLTGGQWRAAAADQSIALVVASALLNSLAATIVHRLG